MGVFVSAVFSLLYRGRKTGGPCAGPPWSCSPGISQDLKTGYLVGATPAKQQAGQFLGAAFACWAVAAIVLLLGRTYTFGSPELPAPQATLMKTVIDGVLTGSLPWGLVGTGAAFSLSGLLAGLPGLAFAVGLYLPLGSLTPIFLGGAVRRLVEARQKEGPREGGPRHPRRLGHDRWRRPRRSGDRRPRREQTGPSVLGPLAGLLALREQGLHVDHRTGRDRRGDRPRAGRLGVALPGGAER